MQALLGFNLERGCRCDITNNGFRTSIGDEQWRPKEGRPRFFFSEAVGTLTQSKGVHFRGCNWQNRATLAPWEPRHDGRTELQQNVHCDHQGWHHSCSFWQRWWHCPWFIGWTWKDLTRQENIKVQNCMCIYILYLYFVLIYKYVNDAMYIYIYIMVYYMMLYLQKSASSFGTVGSSP